MERLSKRIEIGANIAIIAVAGLLGFVLVKNYLIAKPQEKTDIAESASQPKNTRISLPDVDWSKNGQTLVLAVSSACHFCTESGPFYQQLAKTHGRTRLLAVLPQPVEEGRRYLDKLNVTVDEIKQSSLDSIDVRGTPTLLLVNSEGVVTNTWIGKLQAEQEAEVLSKAK
jgi:hypothetical protein